METFAILFRSVEISERGEHANRGIECVREPEAAHVPFDEGRLPVGHPRGLSGLRQEGPREVEASHAISALRQSDRMAARPAGDVQDRAPLSEMEDLVNRLDLGIGLRVHVTDEVVRPEEILKPSLWNLRHRRAANAT